jgi:hypothetical protein
MVMRAESVAVGRTGAPSPAVESMSVLVPAVSAAFVSGRTRTVAPVSVLVTLPLTPLSSLSSLFRAHASETARAPKTA